MFGLKRSAAGLALVLLLAGCTTYPTAADLSPQEAWAVTVDRYEAGYTDTLILNAGIREGASLGDLPGLGGDAWRLGRDDQNAGCPRRSAEELREWLALQGAG